jgi:hypothetical protein
MPNHIMTECNANPHKASFARWLAGAYLLQATEIDK